MISITSLVVRPISNTILSSGYLEVGMMMGNLFLPVSGKVGKGGIDVAYG